MARSTDWLIYTQESGLSWVSDGYIYRPNSDFDIQITSNQVKVQLADGSFGFTIPETKYAREQLSFVWTRVDLSFVSQIVGYIQNHDYLKIVDHDSTVYIGRFISCKRIWLTGVDEDDDGVDFEAVFEIHEL